jgi:uncharacterized membrane protein YhiD involved in acid resistance
MSTFNLPPLLLNLAVAPGIGLLIGAERERRKGEGPARAAAGIRTFAVVSLVRATSLIAGGALVLAITIAGVAALTAIAYFRSRDRPERRGWMEVLTVQFELGVDGMFGPKPA